CGKGAGFVTAEADEADDGAAFMMDYLKTSAPFWKKEHRRDGSAGDWVSAKDADTQALDKWR
ncbi:MAG: hypothetical protein IE911_17835, partial [Brevundimonas sp.]|nr:hypothetical protein [Brevundimonas sp.]